MNNLDPEAQGKWGHLPFITQRTEYEWSAACPSCGDSQHIGNDKPDRFRIFAPKNSNEKWRGYCRRCQFFEFVDSGTERKLPLIDVIAMRREQEHLRKAEQERLRDKIDALQHAAYWRGWHDGMQQSQRHLWYSAGIGDRQIDYYNLGYCADHAYSWNGETFHSDTLTIPHYTFGFKPINVQHRLLHAVEGAGKYRQLPGLPAAAFLTDPESSRLEQQVLIVEGAKKAMVVFDRAGAMYNGKPISIVGVPSKTPGKNILGQFADCESILLALDPDACFGPDSAAQTMSKELGSERTKIVRLPVKPDDFFVRHGGTQKQFQDFLRQARSC